MLNAALISNLKFLELRMEYAECEVRVVSDIK